MVGRIIRGASATLAASLILACGNDSVAGPSANALASPTCGPASVVSLGPNRATTLACTSGSYITLARGARYLVVPQLAVGGTSLAGAPVSYQIGVPGGASQISANREPVTPPAATPAPASSITAQQRFDAVMRSRAEATVRSGTTRLAGASASTRASASASVPDLGTVRTFRVVTGSGLQTSIYGTVAGRLSYIGNNILVYIDTLAPLDGFTPAQLQAFSQYFDQTLYPIDIGAFGAPADLDANGHIIMLLSPTVNALTPAAECASQGYVAGYFNGTDFLSNSNSNHGEVFYAVVPDPAGSASCAHSVSDILGSLPATFLHELQHLISFSQHVSVQGGTPEEGWLDEGMSIRAEELGAEYFEARYPGPAGRTNPAQLFPDSAQGFVAGFLGDSYTYLLRTDTASVTTHDDSDDGFSWRGSDWLLIHWLGDLKGKSVYPTIEHSRLTGVANLAAAAGQSFGSLFGDFSLSLWTDSIVGTPRASVPAPDRFQSRNLRVLYQRLFASSAGNPAVPRAYPLLPTPLTTTAPVTASMVRGAMAFYTLDLTNAQSNVAIQFAAPGGSGLAASLGPQVSIYRLPN